MSKLLFWLVILLATVITTSGDIFLKLASKGKTIDIKWFLLGLFIYGLSAIAWTFSYRFGKLSTIGPIYGIFTILLFTGYTIFLFHEKVSPIEMVGIGMALGSLILLARFG